MIKGPELNKFKDGAWKDILRQHIVILPEEMSGGSETGNY
jgi:hypothetical protein